MPLSLLDRVLTCPSLPSLPGVAVRVLELTRDPNVSLAAIALTIQADPALAIRVLKTVNSSYYALPKPCSGIAAAMGMLGLNTVKSLVLGFSLVDSSKKAGLDGGFDMTVYWRRAVYSAAAARAIALSVRACDPEEAFIAALVQDVGMLACYAALKDEYAAVLATAPADHHELAGHEHKALGIDHAQVGQLLAKRWNLPPQLVECIGAHHNPVSASPAHQSLVRAVSVGGLAAGALTATDSKRKLGAFIIRCREWFQLDQPAARRLLEQGAIGAGEVAKLLGLKTGAVPDVGQILSQAHEQLLVAQEAVQQETVQLRHSHDELARSSVTDALTGVFNRAQFDRELGTAFSEAKSNCHPLSVVFIDADRFKSVNDTHGHQAGDAVLKELARRMKVVVDGCGVLCRYGGEEFAVILPKVGAGPAAIFAEQLRKAVGSSPFALGAALDNLHLPVTISLGVGSLSPANSASIMRPEQITLAADRAVYAAKAGGPNCVKTVDPAAPATPVITPAEPSFVAEPAAAGNLMIVEDDPLSSRLLAFLFAKHKDLKPMLVRSAEEALDWVAHPTPAHPRPDAVLCDLHLPGVSGIELIESLRASTTGSMLPFLIMTGTPDQQAREASAAAGVDGFIDKADLCVNTSQWPARIAEMILRARTAA